MRAHLPRMIGAAAALFLAAAGTAQAQGKGKGHEKNKDRGQVVERTESTSIADSCLLITRGAQQTNAG